MSLEACSVAKSDVHRLLLKASSCLCTASGNGAHWQSVGPGRDPSLSQRVGHACPRAVLATAPPLPRSGHPCCAAQRRRGAVRTEADGVLYESNSLTALRLATGSELHNAPILAMRPYKTKSKRHRSCGSIPLLRGDSACRTNHFTGMPSGVTQEA